jgi:hypothetical protein
MSEGNASEPSTAPPGAGAPGAGTHGPGEPGGAAAGAGEELDALPVPVEHGQLVRPVRAGPLAGEWRQGSLPAAQVAAVAAGGFLAGAAFARLVHRRQRSIASARRARELARGGRRRGRAAGRAGELVQIVGSRSLLLDVHLLGGSDG